MEGTHGDWHALDAEADRIAAESARVDAAIKGELEEAERAVSAISKAAAKAREAGSWSGSYGVVITGSPGSDILSTGRRFLEDGHYSRAREEAEQAYRMAAAAIDEAEAEVSRKRRREEEREAAERRRREEEEESRRRSLSSSSGDSWGSSSWSSGGSSSWGSSSSGSGMSGWGSSGSGTAMSGW